MPGVSFDRAASFYDATRALPEGVTDQIRDALVQRLDIRPDWRMLEIGIGTGRIALPFIRAGYDYWGVDISSAMLQVLREHLAPQSSSSALQLHNPPGEYALSGVGMATIPQRVQLIQGDVMKLPLISRHFDALLSMHVLHLVDDWQATLHESVRVLRPGGYLVLLNDEHAQAASPSAGDQVQAAWSRILDELGVPEEQRRARAVRGLNQHFIDFLHVQAVSVERISLVSYHKQPISIREVVQQYKDRLFSSLWFIPDELYAQACERLEAWMSSQCAQPDQPLERPGSIDALIGRIKDEV